MDIKDYKFRTEIHAHTSPVSSCGHVTADETVKAYLEMGANGLTITNHLNPNWMSGSSSERAEEYVSDYLIAKKAAEGTSLNVIFGVEIRFPENDNDYLVYGVSTDEVEEMIALLPFGISEFYKKFKKPLNLILQAHPFRNGMVHAPLDVIDGIEVFNLHPHHNSRIGLAAKYAADNDLIISGGSDFHDAGWHGLCLLGTKTPMRDSFDVADALRSRDVIFDISGNVVFPYQN